MTNKRKNLYKNRLIKALIVIVMIVIAFLAGIVFSSFQDSKNETDSTAIHLDLKDIGELATQEANCTEVINTNTARELFGLKVPFTNSVNIYSYTVHIKAGIDFTKASYSVKNETVLATIPKAKVLSVEIDPDSYKLYLETESVFRPITLDENNEALKKLRDDALREAIDNGLLKNAESNGEQIIKAFLANQYNFEEYNLEFKYED